MKQFIYKKEFVEKAIRKIFQNKNIDDVLRVLNRYQGSTSDGKRRVQLAILKICEGDYEKLDYYVDVANRDYRDILMLAEFDEKKKCELEEPYKDLLA